MFDTPRRKSADCFALIQFIHVSNTFFQGTSTFNVKFVHSVREQRCIQNQPRQCQEPQPRQEPRFSRRRQRSWWLFEKKRVWQSSSSTVQTGSATQQQPQLFLPQHLITHCSSFHEEQPLSEQTGPEIRCRG